MMRINTEFLHAARVTAALALCFLGYWLLNYSLFPIYDGLFIWTREVSALVGGLTLAAVAFAAAWNPALLRTPTPVGAVLMLSLVADLILISGLYFSLAPLLVVGTILNTVANGLISILCGMACLRLKRRSVALAITAAFTVAYAMRWLFLQPPVDVAVIAYLLSPIFALLLVGNEAKTVVPRILAASPPLHAAVTKPSTFVGLSSQIFICIALFRVAYGFMLTFGEQQRIPLLSDWAVICFVVLLLVGIIKRGPLQPDRLFPGASLLVIAGFLALPINVFDGSTVANTLLTAGVGLFEVFILYVLVTIGQRNKANAIVVLAWGYSLNSLGTLVGANIGRLTNWLDGNDPGMITVVSGLAVLLFVSYLLIYFRGFSFDNTIEAIRPDDQLVVGDDTASLGAACAVLSSRHNLTARESEVLLLLARGRSSKVIQEELHISYNTAKAHVKHIYTKLDIHSQQELIDLADNARTTHL
jgi:DNA-binding CsgD family transcriptional regulator